MAHRNESLQDLIHYVIGRVTVVVRTLNATNFLIRASASLILFPLVPEFCADVVGLPTFPAPRRTEFLLLGISSTNGRHIPRAGELTVGELVVLATGEMF
jgi:hypothetical protein